MNQKTKPLLRVLPFAYLLLTALFLYLHFSRYEGMSLVLENVSYKGKMTIPTGFSPARISRLELSTNGLKVLFRGSRSLTMKTEDGIIRKLTIEDLKEEENAVILSFKYGVFIRVTSLPNKSSIDITVPQTIPPVTELVLDCGPMDNYQISLDEKNRMILSDGTSSFFLNSSGNIRYQKGKLYISMTDRVSHTLALEDKAPGLGRTVREWLANGGKDVPGRSEGIRLFSDKAYEGWIKRFDKNSGSWKMPDGGSSFSEKALVLFLSETYRRGEASLLAGDLLKAAEKHNSDLSWYSSPFSGDIVNKSGPILRSGPETLLTREKELKPDANPDLSPYKEILELKRLLDQNVTEETVLWIEENIYPLIVWLEEGLYIFHPDNPVSDTLFTLEASELLEKAGEESDTRELLSIAAQLRNSILERADENGILPSQISFSRERASQGEGSIAPEEVFALYESREYAPAMLDLSRELGEGNWLYSAAESSSVQVTEQYLEINLDFPKGQIHHLVIKGVEPFDRLFLHNIRWKSDPRFQRYSDGWVYDSVSKTLYMKIKHRKTRETVRIQFNPPTPVEPASEDGGTTENGSESSGSDAAATVPASPAG